MPADYCGAFTIDSIDQFGTLEQINVSFDDPVWNSASTCIYYGDASVTASASVSADGDAIRFGIGQISGTATAVVSATRTRFCVGSVTASASVSSDSIRIRTSAGQITGVATVSALGGVQYSGVASVSALALLQANGVGIFTGSGFINGTGLVVCAGNRLGDNWTLEAAGSESWQDISPQDNVWADTSIGSESWTPTTTSNNSWTDKTIGTQTWQ